MSRFLLCDATNFQHLVIDYKFLFIRSNQVILWGKHCSLVSAIMMSDDDRDIDIESDVSDLQWYIEECSKLPFFILM